MTSWPVPRDTSPASQAVASSFNPDGAVGAIKILVSNNIAGLIIGRAGQTISELQSESNTRIKLSQAGDNYPGTQDRVCLVKGEPKAVNVAIRLLMERMYKLHERQHSPAWQQQAGSASSFDFVVRLLVPQSCCGMIIGKSGSNIKFLERSSGVSSFRLSSKDEITLATTSERVVTLTGRSMESCVQCVCLVFDGMTSHPDISHYSNMTTSYASCMVPAAYESSSGSTPRSRQQQNLFLPSSPASSRYSHPEQRQPVWASIPATASFSPSRQRTLDLTRRISSSPDLPVAMFRHLPSAQRPQYPGENLHNRLPLKVSGMNTTYSRLQQANVGAMPGNQQQPLALPSMSGHVPLPGGPTLVNFGVGTEGPDDLQHRHHHHYRMRHHSLPNSASLPNLLAIQADQSLPLPLLQPQSLRVPLQPQPPPEYSNSALAFQIPIMIAPGCFHAQVLAPDSMIGSILGRGGRTLTDLQMVSGTRVQISQRDEFMPGTQCRIVTIRGPNAESVWQAQFLIGQRMVLPLTAGTNHTGLTPTPPPVQSSGSPPVRTVEQGMDSGGTSSPPS